MMRDAATGTVARGDADTAATLLQFIHTELSTHHCAVSIGCLGAIAEFHDETATVTLADDDTLTGASPRGALRLRLRDGASAIAYEALSAHDDAWQYGIALTARGRGSRGPSRTVLTELGPDRDAIRSSDRAQLLFDLGVGMPNVDYCVRTADAALIARLRADCGQRVTITGNALIEALIDASPHRVALSPLARIEVYQAIDRHRTPSGPHTHLLPDLLARRRTHAANLPLPAQTLPLVTLHPENPLFDRNGHRRPFAPTAYARFQTTLERHGVPAYVEEKQRLRAALVTGVVPERYVRPRTRAGRLALRIALRQLAHDGVDAATGAMWRAHFRR